MTQMSFQILKKEIQKSGKRAIKNFKLNFKFNLAKHQKL